MPASAGKNVQVRYYALLREERGLDAEWLSTEAKTLSDLYKQLKERHDLSLGQERMSVAINDSFANWQDSFSENDVIVFLPPVAGG